MLIQTISALSNKLKSINNDILVNNACKPSIVNILTEEKYREYVAKETTDKVDYPIIIIKDGSIQYDKDRFSNDDVVRKQTTVNKDDGTSKTFSDIYKPFLPYNLNYTIEILCKKRIQIDSMILWVLKEIPEKGILDVPYVDSVTNENLVYEALTKRSDIIKADEQTSSTLYRRIFDLRISTLLDDSLKESVIQVIGSKFIITHKE